jgi:hypothetical protein
MEGWYTKGPLNELGGQRLHSVEDHDTVSEISERQ